LTWGETLLSATHQPDLTEIEIPAIARPILAGNPPTAPFALSREKVHGREKTPLVVPRRRLSDERRLLPYVGPLVPRSDELSTGALLLPRSGAAMLPAPRLFFAGPRASAACQQLAALPVAFLPLAAYTLVTPPFI
jgi:hypothetical protein